MFLPAFWIYLVMYFHIKGELSGSSDIIDKEYKALGKMTIAEIRVFAIITLYAQGFVFRGVWYDFLDVKGLAKDSKVAILAARLLFFNF